VYQALYGYDQGMIPVVVHTLATATNKVATLAALIRALQASGQASGGSGSGINQMMLFEIQCAEPWQSIQPAAWSGQRGSFAYQTWLETARQWQVMCPLIPRSARRCRVSARRAEATVFSSMRLIPRQRDRKRRQGPGRDLPLD
jgi:hypothetical protein